MNILLIRQPARLKYFRFITIFLTISVFCPTWGDDSSTTIGDLSARIEELEKQLGQQDNANDSNPGARVSYEDLEQLKDEMRALRDARTGTEDMGALRDELKDLREEIRHLKSENINLQKRKRNQQETIDDDMDSEPANVSKKPRTFSTDPSRNNPITTKEPQESWQQTPMSSLEIDEEADEETASVLEILKQSAPKYGETSEENLEKTRESATKHAEETAPKLTTGTAREKNSLSQYNEAFALYDKGAYKEAERAFSYFIKAYPNDPLASKALYWKAVSMMKQGKNKEAQILLVTAYKKNPKGPKAADCLLRLGETFALLGKKENACIAWKRLEDDFAHMTDEVKAELKALKEKYGCSQKPGKPSKAASKATSSSSK